MTNKSKKREDRIQGRRHLKDVLIKSSFTAADSLSVWNIKERHKIFNALKEYSHTTHTHKSRCTHYLYFQKFSFKTPGKSYR